jgi:hypothetical protein
MNFSGIKAFNLSNTFISFQFKMIVKIKLFFLLAISATLISKTTSQKSSICPKAKPVAKFSVAKLTGQWFMTHKYSNFETKYKVDNEIFKDFDGSCISLNITYSASQGILNLLIRFVSKEGKSKTSNRTAKLNPDGTFFQKVKILSSKRLLFHFTKYWSIYLFFNTADVDLVFSAIDVDYNNFAAFHACAGITGLGRVQVGWIHSRKRTLDQRSMDRATNAFKAQNLFNGVKLDSVVQAGCSNWWMKIHKHNLNKEKFWLQTGPVFTWKQI